jgi:hypothetical protein
MNKTLYIPDKHAPAWREAARLIRKQYDLSLSAYLNQHMTRLVAEHRSPKNARPVEPKR